MSAPALAAARGDSGIRPYLSRLDQLLKEAVARARAVFNAGESDEAFHGLYISEEEVDALVERETGAETIGSAASAEAFVSACGSLPGMEAITQRSKLATFDHAGILLALAPEVDLRYERIYAYLQDDVTRRRPTVQLALTLLAPDAESRIANRARFAAGSPLIKSGVLTLVADPGQVEPPLLAHYLKLDESTTRLLLGDRGLDHRLANFCELSWDVKNPDANTDALRRLPGYVAAALKNNQAVRLLFTGPASSIKPGAAALTAAAQKLPLLTADLTNHAGWRTDPAAIASLLTREAGRTGAVLSLTGLESATDPALLRVFLDGILQHDGIVIIASASAALAAAIGSGRALSVDFPLPDFETRRTLWQKELQAAPIAVDSGTVSRLANHFLHASEQIGSAVQAARQALDWRASSGETVSLEDVASEVMKAARGQSGMELESLTSKLHPVYTWSDIILPDDTVAQLKEICQRVAHSHNVLEQGGFGKKLSAGKGVAVLFAGPSGTGKTMSAEVIANELGLDLFRIDLSTVVSKYIGETEKNLERIFNAATRSNSVLLFDEADALCGKRSEVRDAHDRYANIEISYLLQKMEQYEGITILTTNLRGNLDEAFVRRLAFTVHFPFPDEADRKKIWERMWPAETKLDPDLDFRSLAKHFKLSGGNIKNVALSTAFLAAAESRPVRMSDILHATRREYEKAGKVVSAAELLSTVES